MANTLVPRGVHSLQTWRDCDGFFLFLHHDIQLAVFSGKHPLRHLEIVEGVDELLPRRVEELQALCADLYGCVSI